MSFYSFENTRGEAVFPGLRIPLVGRTTDGMNSEFTTPDIVTYTEVDGHGVHVVAVDVGSGSITVTLQGTGLPSTLLRGMLNAMRLSRVFSIGTVTISDLTGTNSMCILTNCMLATQPGIAYGPEQPTIPWRFVGHLTVRHLPPLNLQFGLTPPPPPQI